MRRAAQVGKSKIKIGFKGLANSVDSAVLDMAYAAGAYGFAFENEMLTGEIGIDAAAGFYPNQEGERHAYPPIPDGMTVKNVFLYRRHEESGEHDDRIVAQLESGRFIYTAAYRNDEWHEVPRLVMMGDVCAVNYNYNGHDVLLMSSGVDPLVFLNGESSTVCMEAPHFTSIAVHNERVYGSVNGSQNQVWFSDDFDPTNWQVSSTEAGYISFFDECGEVLKVVSFLNYLYIFRDYGIFRLTAYGEQSEFLLKKVFTDTGRIVKSSIEICGDKILFYAEDGLYAFDGYEVRRVCKEMPKPAGLQNMCGAYLDDCYYLACKLTDGEGGNNSIVRYCLSKNSISILRGVDVYKIRTMRMYGGSQIVALVRGANLLGETSKSGKVLGVCTQKKYISPYSALSTSAFKIVRSVSFVSEYPAVLTVVLDGERYEFCVDGSPLLQTVFVDRCGRRFGIELSASGDKAKISPLTVYIDILKE